MYEQSTASGAFDFMSTGTWAIVRNLALFFVAVFWLAVAVWVYKDSKRRVEGPWLVGMATPVGLVPPLLGAPFYFLLPPPPYPQGGRERELEIPAVEGRLATRALSRPVCRAPGRAT